MSTAGEETKGTDTGTGTGTGSVAKQAKTDWRDVPERGSGFGIAFLVRLATFFGRAVGRFFVRVIAFYYALFYPPARRHANDFLRRVGAPTGFFPAYRQILRFAEVALDALFLVQGKDHYFEVKHHGHHHLAKLRDEKRGAILLGAHLGSFYAMRAKSRERALRLHPLVYTKNAARINAALRELDPSSRTELVEMTEGDMSFMLRVREIVEDGGILAILADRVPKDGRTVEVDFLGGKARLPVGPYILAATLRCPVYFTCGLYRAPNTYELHCEPLADRIDLPRGQRMEAVQAYAQQYADKLAAYAESAPDNWFNFYDFWA
jgi:predicted LPLAT superfamily acyltransferase